MSTIIPANRYQRRDALTAERFHTDYQLSLANPESFWGNQASLLDFSQPWQQAYDGDFSQGTHQWFVGGCLNACYNCVDRHVAEHGDDLAVIWQGEAQHAVISLTYRQLHRQVSQLGNVLKHYGVGPGDRVGIYLPMIPEAMVAMLACARIGAVHCVVFAGFSAESLANRFNDIGCRVVITAETGVRAAKTVALKQSVNEALEHCPLVNTVLVVKTQANQADWVAGRDVDYQQALQAASDECPCQPMPSDAPLFILHTSGSTGKPKGIVHSTAGYLLYTALTFKVLFDYQAGEVYWCTADIGWITGHSYGVYGPLANRATVLLFEGVPTYPDASRSWQIIDQHRVAIFYTAPTLLRSLMREGDSYLAASTRDSLRVLGTVGEPINPSVWQWYYDVVGKQRCPIVDTWWQTETGGVLIAPIIGITPLQPGAACQPFWGVAPALFDEQQQKLVGPATGYLVIEQAWPGLMRSIYKDHPRFIDQYLTRFPGAYLSGDGAKRDALGDYWIIGRLDDVLNCSGHRIGTAELESALVAQGDIAEAAVVGYPHAIKGEGIYAFVVTKQGVMTSEALQKALRQQVSAMIGPIAKPDVIQFCEALPKTRSGKILRRLLKKIAAGTEDFGDISTLTDPAILSHLVQGRNIMA